MELLGNVEEFKIDELAREEGFLGPTATGSIEAIAS